MNVENIFSVVFVVKVLISLLICREQIAQVNFTGQSMAAIYFYINFELIFHCIEMC